MRIASLEPIHEIEYLSARSGGGTVKRPLQFFRARVDKLPAGLDGIVATGDLQGIAEGALLGEKVADELSRLRPEKELGILLAGDLYSAPNADVRGASGDVRSVWRAFVARHRWVTGVAGNHDTFGEGHDQGKSFRECCVLDGQSVEIDGLRMAGVGGIIGDPRKPGRVEEREFLRAIKKVVATRPQVLVLHQGPDAERGELRGHAAIRRTLDHSGELLVVCGHCYWPTPTAELRGGAQVLNVDGRVVLLEEDRPARV